MASTLTTLLLWTMTIIGAWNGMSMLGRIYYRMPWWPYAWHVLTGLWAAVILVLR